jgi:Tfp pilus assembly protein PilN
MPAKTKVMIDINLLPPDLAPKRFVKLNNVIIAFLIILISISLFGPLWKLRAEVKGYADMIEIKDQQIKEYQKEAERIHDLRSKVKLLKTRLSVVQELLQEKSTWSDKLVELYECIPNYGVWMDMLTIEYKNNQRQTPGVKTVSMSTKEIMVYISGTVTSVDKVSEFLASLEDSETFGNVVFDSVSSSQVAPGVSVPSSISFRIGVQILVPGEIMQKSTGHTGQKSSI